MLENTASGDECLSQPFPTPLVKAKISPHMGMNGFVGQKRICTRTPERKAVVARLPAGSMTWISGVT